MLRLPALNFSKEIFKFNLIISPVIGFWGLFTGSSVADTLIGFFLAFSFSLFTGGFLFAIYFYFLKYKSRFCFYYNLGLDKPRLIIIAWLFNLPVVLIIYILIIIINAI